MIGNDVVDLTLAALQSNWKRKGYLKKIFSASEQELIMTADCPEAIIWTLWSMKEAAYKIYNRKTGQRGYFPHLLICSFKQLNKYDEGYVNYNGSTCYTITTIQDNILHTIAVEDEKNLYNIRHIDHNKVIKDDKGLPFLHEEKHFIPASLSHHGRGIKAVAMI